ncbi:MAG TPA: F0F1 ATP synthase subunit B [Candidatus Blautia gallistercoris]|uniref:ATP synthase subunit b n=1 Tax=Candidatus Blautia gallistercoris TaxID=2838490 RepID=A0A9D1WI67_9FIRM|nr:F0F1 ATP synthase subunit B [Candidatus Blautia gallistercoris]
MLNVGWDLVFTIINLVVLYLAMKKFLIGPVTGIMEKRRQMIEGGLETARKKEEEALALKNQYEEALGAAREESMQILENSRKTAKKEEERILREADKKAKELLEKNRLAMEVQKEQMMGEMQSEVARLAMTAAAKVLGQENSSLNDKKLYDQFLSKAGESYDTENV